MQNLRHRPPVIVRGKGEKGHTNLQWGTYQLEGVVLMRRVIQGIDSAI